MVDYRMQVHSFSIPTHVYLKTPPQSRQHGWLDPIRVQLRELEPETLSQLCSEFRADVFRQAGLADPLGTVSPDESETPAPPTPARQPVAVVWRVRTLSCSGGFPGREWSAEFFLDQDRAAERLQALIAQSDQANPDAPFRKELETLDGVSGYCNWRFGTMLAMDSVSVA